MEHLIGVWAVLELGGVMMYPLLFLALVGSVVMLEKGLLFWRYGRLPRVLVELVESHDFGWADFERELMALEPRNYYGRFFRAILSNRSKPVWWVESQAGNAAQRIEKILNRGLWMLDTVVTAAPLMGLLGTIMGMMQAFKMIGGHGLADPSGVTTGVAEALIATAFGLLIALITLFGFNFLSRLQSQTLDEMERIGSRLLDRMRLDQERMEATREAA